MAVLNVNGKALNHNADPRTPLLWVLREQLGLTGTKYGCGIAQCGACTGHIDGVPTRSCQLPMNSVGSRKITTIEGLAQGGRLTKVQQAWVDNEVPQRQMLVIAASMSASVGFGLAASSAVAAMIMPL